MTPLHQPVDPLKMSHNQQRTQRWISKEDEDLLDLMVRIAETPAEWERIHRVLSQIGAEEKESSESSKSTNSDKKDEENASNPTRSSHISSVNTTNKNVHSVSKTNLSEVRNMKTFSTTQETSTVLQDLDYPSDQGTMTMKAENSDTGWPDFEEAITNKIKKTHNPVEDNDILSRNWYEDEWTDSAWDEFVKLQNEKSSPPNDSENRSPSVSFIPSSESSPDKTKHPVRSRLFRDPKILEFPLKEESPVQNQSPELNTTREEGFNRSLARGGMFLYHRVTTSPQERKGNSAFIAVSVVKQSLLQPPPVPTSAPAVDLYSRWNQSKHLHRIQDMKAQPGVPHRKHQHRGNHSHHSRRGDHRHHHSHSSSVHP